MRKGAKCFPLCLALVLAVPTLLMISSANAQTIPAPSTPTFTLKLLSYAYSTPSPAPDLRSPSYGTNLRATVQVTINNQQLPSNLDSGKYSLYYSIRFKVHSQQDFSQIAVIMPINNLLSPDPSEASITEELQGAIQASNGNSTVYQLETGGFNINSDDKLDFQVEAIIGHSFNRWEQGYKVTYSTGYQDLGPVSGLAVTQDSESSWSETQTLALPQSTPSPTSNLPVISLSSNAIIAIIGAIAIVSLALVITLFLYVRRLKKNDWNSTNRESMV